MEDSHTNNVKEKNYQKAKPRNNRGVGSSRRYQQRGENLNTSTSENYDEFAAYQYTPGEFVTQNHTLPNYAERNPTRRYQSQNYNKQLKDRNFQCSVPEFPKMENNNSDAASNSKYPENLLFEKPVPDTNVNIHTASNRGNIVGGRYIRKRLNQSSSDSYLPSEQNISTVRDEKYAELPPDNKFNDARNFPFHNDKAFGQNRAQTNYHFKDHQNSSYFRNSVNSNPRNHQNKFYSRTHHDSQTYDMYNNAQKFEFMQDTSKRHDKSKDQDNEYPFSNRNMQRKATEQKFLTDHKHATNYASEGVSNYKSGKNIDGQNKSFSERSYGQNKFSKVAPKNVIDNNATQRELLMERLNKGESECLVCCENIRIKDQIWHCLNCFHVFHLRCVRKWARSPAAIVENEGWRCPACQSIINKVPYDYYCFCGRNRNPDVNYHLTPHSCGDICGRKGAECEHLCKELCHPGPCPPCQVVVQKICACGKTSKSSLCNQNSKDTCQSICERILNCGVHRCVEKCHTGVCPLCEVIVTQRCYCDKHERTVSCTADTATCFKYSCGNTCGKQLNCSFHTCDAICHSGSCNECQLSVDIVKTCHCGQSKIHDLVASAKATERKSCMDPIPVCGEICRKVLPCGPKDNPHTCQSLCHEGICPPCELTTSLKCRCGAFTKEFPCVEISASFLYLCEKRCSRRKDCGRHKCLNNCCVNIEHRCELVCNRKLSCGLHHCQETCHGGNCPTCWNVSFDELRCHCGTTVLYPPIHCGTKPPECSEPCIRSHPCDHKVRHSCHSDEKCPPCTELIVKWCYGKHKQLGSVMCFLDGISCGMLCYKPLPCGVHKCQLTCHSGPCLQEGAKCTQACVTPRAACGHPCGNPCHTGDCPDTPCKSQVTLSCPCGHRSETSTCYDSTKTYRLMSVSVLASKMQEIKDGQTVNLNDVLGRKQKNSKLQCNEECAVIERNKRVALALQIQNPDLSCSPGPPSYSEFLKDEAKKNPHFVSEVYDKIADLVQLSKESKQKCRSHSFPPMNRSQRRIVHELAEFFGCSTESYDEEPKKNVVVTAHKSKCWLPFVSIMTVVQRDMGFRKGPAPLLAQREVKPSSSSSVSSAVSQKKKVDYFDYNA